MNAILKALHSTDAAEAAEASRAFCARAKRAGKDPQALYTEMMMASGATEKLAKRSAVSFADVLLGSTSVAKRAPIADDDEMDDDEKKGRGIAAAAPEVEEIVDDDDENDEDATKPKRRSVAGTTAKHTLSKNVSFTSIVAPASKAFPIEEQESARQPRGVDTGTDPSGDREYSDSVMDRIAGPFASKQGGDPDAIPNAGAGETWEGDARDVPNSDFRPAANQDAAYIGGAERPYTPSNPGRDGAYKLESEGLEPGAGVVRMGPNFVLPGKTGGEGLSAPFIAPGPRTNVLKRDDLKRDRRVSFRSVVEDESSMKPFDGR